MAGASCPFQDPIDVAPFSIQCTTCRARLRVRTEAALGQILACPKCGSMVLVQAPELNAEHAAPSKETPHESTLAANTLAPSFPETLAAGAASTGPAAIPTFEDVGLLISDAGNKVAKAPTPATSHATAAVVSTTTPGNVAGPSSPQPVANSKADSQPLAAAVAASLAAVIAAPMVHAAEEIHLASASLPSLPPPVTPFPEMQPPAIHGEPIAPPVQSVASMVMPAAEKSSLIHALPGWAATPMAVAGGLLLSIVALVLFVQFGARNNGAAAAVANIGAETQSAAPSDSSAITGNASQNEATVNAAEAEPKSPAHTPNLSAEARQAPAPSETVTAAKKPADKPNADDLNFDEPKLLPPAPQSKQATAAPTTAEKPAPIDDGAALAKAELPQTKQGSPKAPPGFAFGTSAEPPLPVADGLGQFAGFIDSPANIPQALQESQPSAPAAKPLEQATPSRVPPRKVDVAARLADPLVEVDVRDMPLAAFVHMMSNLSTIPFTVDPVSLHMGRITPETNVSVKLASTSVGKVMDAALKPLHLHVVSSEGQACIERIPLASGPTRRLQHDLTDLSKGDEKLPGQLVKLIPAWFEPSSWQAHGGRGLIFADEGKLAVEQTPRVHYQILILAEKLRAARSLPHKSPLPASQFALDSQAIRGKLQTSIHATWLQPTRFADVLASLEQMSGMRILVDWRQLATEHFGPGSEVTLATQGDSLEGVLDTFLRPRDLAYRIIDESTIQITAASEYNQTPVLALYSCKKIAAANGSSVKLLAEARKTVGKNNELFLDAPSQCLVAWLTPPEQAALARWIAAQK